MKVLAPWLERTLERLLGVPFMDRWRGPRYRPNWPRGVRPLFPRDPE